jgi:uncharacterized membrane protein YtjA (UPF0391 family)
LNSIKRKKRPARLPGPQSNMSMRKVVTVCGSKNNKKEIHMDLLYLGVVFLVIALIAGFFGFYSVEHSSVEIAKILFFVFIVLCVLAFLSGTVIFPAYGDGCGDNCGDGGGY